MTRKLSYSELQKALKELRTKGAVLLVKLNAKEVLLQREYERLTRDYTLEQEAFENYIRPQTQTVRTTPELIELARKSATTRVPLTKEQVDEQLKPVYARQRELSNKEVASEASTSGTVQRTYRNTPVSAPLPVKPVSNYDTRNKPARQQQYDRRVRDAVKPEPKKVVELPKVKVEYSKKDKSEFFSTYTSRRAA